MASPAYLNLRTDRKRKELKGKEYQSILFLLVLLQRKKYFLSQFLKLPESITGKIHRAIKNLQGCSKLSSIKGQWRLARASGSI